MNKTKPLTVRDALRTVSRILSPVAAIGGKALSVGEYKRGQEQPDNKPSNASFTPKRALHAARRPGQQWDPQNTWGHDTESERYEREMWMDQTFWNDNDQGVTYGESTWDGTWNDSEAWRR